MRRHQPLNRKNTQKKAKAICRSTRLQKRTTQLGIGFFPQETEFSAADSNRAWLTPLDIAGCNLQVTGTIFVLQWSWTKCDGFISCPLTRLKKKKGKTFQHLWCRVTLVAFSWSPPHPGGRGSGPITSQSLWKITHPPSPGGEVGQWLSDCMFCSVLFWGWERLCSLPLLPSSELLLLLRRQPQKGGF